MKIGILETGRPPEALQAAFGDYPAMFRGLLGPGFDYVTYPVEQMVLPADPAERDAYVITGSPAGVYDDLPWIEPLKRFLVEVRGQAALVGVCFGHQVMAEAFGGRVVKSQKGWAAGLHTYAIAVREPWMDDAATISIPVSHQDQVVELAPDARVLGGNDFSPYGMLAYGMRAISLQCHPEFDPDYAEALLRVRRGTRLTEAEADAAIATLQAPNDDARVGGWIRRFLEGAALPA